jgi:hypothetical protein
MLHLKPGLSAELLNKLTGTQLSGFDQTSADLGSRLSF